MTWDWDGVTAKDIGGTLETAGVPIEGGTMNYRLYWLGPATEPGTWGLDTGVGTPIWRIFGGWELTGLVTSQEIPPNSPAETPRPRGWINVYPENGIQFSAPQGEFYRRGIHADHDDPITQGYWKYAIKPF